MTQALPFNFETQEQRLSRAVSLLNHLKATKAQADCYYWLTECTQTKDEQDSQNPYKPFPRKPYILPLLQVLENEPVVLVDKSRTMMASWTVAAWATHKALTHPATKVVFQSEDEQRALKLIEYARVLWDRSMPELKQRWPLAKALDRQPGDVFSIGNDSQLIGIVGNPDKVRSEHPSIYVLDEAAHVERGLESWNIAMATHAPHMIALSSAAPGWYADMTEFAKPVDWPDYEQRKAA